VRCPGRRAAVLMLVIMIAGCRDEVVDDGLVGGVNLSSSRCEQAHDKLGFCRPGEAVLADRQVFLDTCEALALRGAKDESEVLIEDASTCHDRYTCPAYEHCMTIADRRAVRGEVVTTAVQRLQALAPEGEALSERSFADDEVLFGAERACATLSEARELEAWRARCGQIFEIGLIRLPIHADTMHCMTLGDFAEQLDGDASARLERACKAARETEQSNTVAEHTKNRAWRDGMRTCEDAETPPSEACRAHALAAREAKLAELAPVFDPDATPELGPDATSELDVHSVCNELERAAKWLGPDELREAEALCKVARRAPDLHESFAGVESALLSLDIEVVRDAWSECRVIENQLAKLEGEWVEAQRERWFELCIVGVARHEFPAAIPEMSGFCPLRVRELYEQLRARDYHDPELDPWLDQAEPICSEDSHR
jgi:hypothetical protein